MELMSLPNPMHPAAAAPTPRLLVTVRPRSMALIRFKEGIIKCLLFFCTLFSVAVTFAIFALLATETLRFFQMPGVKVLDFLTGTRWNPLLGQTKHFGIWPLIAGTLWITGIAMLVAVPLGLITAIFLSEYSPRRLRAFLKPTLEVLAGIPTVVYGFFALTFITPALRWILGPEVDIYNALSAGIAVGILNIPTISSLTEDALQAVPRGLREAAFGLGGTRFDVSVKVVVPAALSGIVSACLLGATRAIGETMIVALAAGNRARISLNPAVEMQTMTGYIAQIAKGDVSNFGVEYYSIYAVATTLFLLTLAMTVAGHFIRKRFREAYE
jgi:phosphate transport system permease protein